MEREEEMGRERRRDDQVPFRRTLSKLKIGKIENWKNEKLRKESGSKREKWRSCDLVPLQWYGNHWTASGRCRPYVLDRTV